MALAAGTLPGLCSMYNAEFADGTVISIEADRQPTPEELDKEYVRMKGSGGPLRQVLACVPGVRMRLPPGWHHIEGATLDKAAKELAATLPKASFTGQRVVAAFQPESNGSEIGFPRVIVILNQTAKLSERELEETARMGAEIQRGADHTLAGNALGASAKLEGVSYDDQHHCVVARGLVSVPGGGIRRELNAMFAADTGLVTFHFSWLEKDYDDYAHLVYPMIDGIEVARSVNDGTATPEEPPGRIPPTPGVAAGNFPGDKAPFACLLFLVIAAVWSLTAYFLGARRAGGSTKQETRPVVNRAEGAPSARGALAAAVRTAQGQIRVAWIAGAVKGTWALCLILYSVIIEPIAGFGLEGLTDVALVFGLSLGIYMRSRTCAVLMVGYCLVCVGLSIQYFGSERSLGGGWLWVLLLVFFIPGVRGAFAYHRLVGQREPAPVAEAVASDQSRTGAGPSAGLASATAPAAVGPSRPPVLPSVALYLYLNGETKGPFSTDQIAALLSVGAATQDTPCCHDGAEKWLIVAAYLPCAMRAAATPPGEDRQPGPTSELKAACPSCGQRVSFPSDALGELASCPTCGVRMELARDTDLTHEMPESAEAYDSGSSGSAVIAATDEDQKRRSWGDGGTQSGGAHPPSTIPARWETGDRSPPSQILKDPLQQAHGGRKHILPSLVFDLGLPKAPAPEQKKPGGSSGEAAPSSPAESAPSAAAQEPMKARCPACRTTFEFPEREIGRGWICPNCGRPVTLRDSSAPRMKRVVEWIKREL